MLNVVSQVAEKYAYTTAITINILDSRLAEIVLSINFDKSQAETIEAAHRWLSELTKCLMEQGILSHRLDIDNINKLYNYDKPYWNYVAKIKHIFDPNNIISPGRFSGKLIGES